MQDFTYFTSEYVSRGHPDKIADQISDAILDVCLEQDPNSRVACETFCTKGQIVVGGEITTKGYVDIESIVREMIDDIGYTKDMDFDRNCGILTTIHAQSPDIATGVDIGGAGDQGMMFGGAVNETPELMPLALVLSREIIHRSVKLKNTHLPWIRPDGKAQITLAYDKNEQIDHVDTVVLSAQHDPNINHKEIVYELKKHVIFPVLEEYHLDPESVKHFYINPTGRFVIGGPVADTGLTGRKIIVDTYGGFFHHGGGCFSGKDPSKVDRSAGYAARWIAKNIVAAGFAKKCEVQLSYAIGITNPISIKVNTFGTSSLNEISLADVVSKIFDLSPRGIEQALELRYPKFKYANLAGFGHIGRKDISLPWEELNKISELKKLLSSN